MKTDTLDLRHMDCQLMQGDCLERMKEIPSCSVDMILTDPPYGTTACKWDSIIDLPLMWEQLKRIIKPDGAIVMTSAQPFTSVLISSNMKDFKYCWTWQKPNGTGHLNAKKQPLRDVEDVNVFYSNQVTYNPQMIKGDPYRNNGSNQLYEGYGKQIKTPTESNGYRYPKQVLQFKIEDRGEFHPTQKPVALMEYMIKTYTNEGDTVLDFTMGSGTTGVASVNLRRNFIGIELDEDYYKAACERIHRETSQATFF